MNYSVVKHNHDVAIASAGLDAKALQQLEEEVFKGNCVVRTFNKLGAVQSDTAKCCYHANTCRAVSNYFLSALDLCIHHLEWKPVHLIQLALQTRLMDHLVPLIWKMPQIITSQTFSFMRIL
jgi:hypothetical protein